MSVLLVHSKLFSRFYAVILYPLMVASEHIACSSIVAELASCASWTWHCQLSMHIFSQQEFAGKQIAVMLKWVLCPACKHAICFFFWRGVHKYYIHISGYDIPQHDVIYRSGFSLCCTRFFWLLFVVRLKHSFELSHAVSRWWIAWIE